MNELVARSELQILMVGGVKAAQRAREGMMKEVARVIKRGREWWEDWPKAGCGPRAPVTLQSYIGTGRRSGQYHTLTVIHRGRTR